MNRLLVVQFTKVYVQKKFNRSGIEPAADKVGMYHNVVSCMLGKGPKHQMHGANAHGN